MTNNQSDNQESRSAADAASEATGPETPPKGSATDKANTQSSEERSMENADSTASADVGETENAEAYRAELEEARQRAIRLQAELENYRKRTQRMMDEERRYASLPLMRDLLTVVDNLQRAIDAAEQHGNASGLLEGVKMVAQHLTDILKRYDCVPIDAEGAPFDPHLHEAIGQHPSPDHEPGTVTCVATVGYRLHDRVVRPSQVLVATPHSDGNAPSGENKDAQDRSAEPPSNT